MGCPDSRRADARRLQFPGPDAICAFRWRAHRLSCGMAHMGACDMTEIPDAYRRGTCSIDGCDKPVRARTWCLAHWTRWSRHGHPLGGGTQVGAPERFYREVVLPYAGDECLTWPFGKDIWGYGHLKRNGRQRLTHRLVCEDVHGEPPTEKHEAAHSCGNGHLGCVNPKHLCWKTHRENEADKVLHGTRVRGSRSVRSKLTESDVLAIRRSSRRHSELARIYGVAQCTISEIRSGKKWAWL